MSLDVARRSIDFIFRHAPAESLLDIGFFGGEPLLEFPLIKKITEMIETHPAYSSGRVSLSITTNGTVYTPAISAFLRGHAIKVCVSCDGPPRVQDLFRRNQHGGETSARVERTLLAMQQDLPEVVINAVYTPQTLELLPESVDYFSALGFRQIYLNPDFTAHWSREDASHLVPVYQTLGQQYIDWYLQHDPHYISLIDTKIAVLVRGGYRPMERCQMGTGELAITPDGGLYPCGRLSGSGISQDHRIGSIQDGVDLSRLVAHCAPGAAQNPECIDCSLRDSCMTWCGCSNAFMTGYYNRVGPFLCASERALIQTAMEVYTSLERQLGPTFLHHLSGETLLNSRMERKGKIL